jgi:cytochrome b561
MVADYIRKNFYWCIFWGFVLQCVGGSVTAMSHSLPVTVLGWSIYLVGTALLLIGFSFYVRAKGRSPAWCLLALLSVIGWVVLILLKDRTLLSLNQKDPEVTDCI